MCVYYLLLVRKLSMASIFDAMYFLIRMEGKGVEECSKDMSKPQEIFSTLKSSHILVKYLIMIEWACHYLRDKASYIELKKGQRKTSNCNITCSSLSLTLLTLCYSFGY